MASTALTQRLRQHSRRSGLMVGFSMAMTILLLVGGFVWIFVHLQPLFSDFVSETPRRSAIAATTATSISAASSDDVGVDLGADVPTPTVVSVQASAPSPTPRSFAPDLRVRLQSVSAVRLRSEPSTTGGDATIVTVLEPGTPLQATGREEPATNPAQDGNVWIEVQTEAGQRGWMRQIDLEPFQG